MDNKPTLDQEVNDLIVKIAELDQRISKLESSGNLDGIYLDGVPENIREYIKEKKGDK